MSYDIRLRKLAQQPAAVIRFRCAPEQISPQLVSAFDEIGRYLNDSGIEHRASSVYARFLVGGPEIDVEAGFTVPTPIAAKGQVKPGELPECEAAVTLHVGPYEELPAAQNAIRHWIAANDREPGGAPWELYLSTGAEPPSQCKTEVYWPLKPE